VRPSARAADGAFAGIDTRIGLAGLRGNERLYRRLLGMFRERELRFEARFRAACDKGDMDEAMRLAHDLKSVSATLGALALAQAADALERACSDSGGG
jgi:HPt (histidine-containing phosphotransfer) domain-containing protein